MVKNIGEKIFYLWLIFSPFMLPLYTVLVVLDLMIDEARS